MIALDALWNLSLQNDSDIALDREVILAALNGVNVPSSTDSTSISMASGTTKRVGVFTPGSTRSKLISGCSGARSQTCSGVIFPGTT